MKGPFSPCLLWQRTRWTFKLMSVVHFSKMVKKHTAAGQILVIAISFRSCRIKSIANPLVKTLIPTLPADTKIRFLCNSEFFYGQLTHRIGSLPTKESRINRWRNNYNPTFPAILSKMRKCRLHAGIETLWVNFLHQLEPFHGRVLHRRPPDRAGVVNQNVKLSIDTDSFIYKLKDLLNVPRIHGDRGGFTASFPDLTLDGVDGRLR